MPQAPGLTAQAHRMTLAALRAPFAQWRLSAVILAATVALPVALVFLANPLIFMLSDAVYGPDAGFFDDGLYLVAYLLFFSILNYPFTIWVPRCGGGRRWDR